MTVETLITTGKKYPAEFVDTLAESAGHYLREWMTANGLPQEVIDLFDNAMLLGQYARSIETDNLADNEAEWLSELVPETADLIIRFGGVFRGPNGTTLPKENTIVWNREPENPAH